MVTALPTSRRDSETAYAPPDFGFGPGTVDGNAVVPSLLGMTRAVPSGGGRARPPAAAAAADDVEANCELPTSQQSAAFGDPVWYEKIDCEARDPGWYEKFDCEADTPSRRKSTVRFADNDNDNEC